MGYNKFIVVWNGLEPLFGVVGINAQRGHGVWPLGYWIMVFLYFCVSFVHSLSAQHGTDTSVSVPIYG